MGNTFDKVMERKQVAALKEKIMLMQDYRKAVTLLKLDHSFKYMVIVKPINIGEGSDENWEGKVRAVKLAIESA